MGYTGTIAIAVIVVVFIVSIFLLPKGLTGLTSSAIIEKGITFGNAYPQGSADIAGSCGSIKLMADYALGCSLCNSRDVREYFWIRKRGSDEYDFLKGDRKIVKAGETYTAEMKVSVCNGDSYEWYVCIDDSKLNCAGKERNFEFSIN